MRTNTARWSNVQGRSRGHRSMLFIRGLLDRLLLLAAVITGGLVPGFITQYVQRLGGRLDQARLDLAPWQQIADQYFHGRLAHLLQNPPASRAVTFHSPLPPLPSPSPPLPP